MTVGSALVSADALRDLRRSDRAGDQRGGAAPGRCRRPQRTAGAANSQPANHHAVHHHHHHQWQRCQRGARQQTLTLDLILHADLRSFIMHKLALRLTHKRKMDDVSLLKHLP